MAAPRFAPTPQPPYDAVIFSSQRREGGQGYAEMADLMMRLAQRQPGYLGEESARDAAGFGITVSYWQDRPSIAQWKAQADHQPAQAQGKLKD